MPPLDHLLTDQDLDLIERALEAVALAVSTVTRNKRDPVVQAHLDVLGKLQLIRDPMP